MHEATPEDTHALVDGIRVVDKPRIALVRTDPLAIIVLLILTALMALGIAFALTHHNRTREVVQTVIPDHTPIVPTILDGPRATIYERWNFSAHLPLDWRETRETLPTPGGVLSRHHTYIHPSNQCVIAYGEFDTATRTKNYLPTVPGEDVTRNETFIGRVERLIPTTQSTTTPDTSTSTTTSYRAGEIALAYQPLFYDNGTHDATRNVWVLFSRDDTPVQSPCHDDFVQLVHSLEPYYTDHALSRDDTGLIYVESDAVRGTHLLFRDDEDQTAYHVATLDRGLIFKPTLYEGILYYVGTEGLLKRYQLFTTTDPTTVPLSLDAEESVNDFRVASNTIEYLGGLWCGDTTAKCDLTHYNHDTLLATTTMLAEHITEHSFTSTDTMVQSLKLTDSTLTLGPNRFEGVLVERIPIAMSI
ncbi:MAG: hypothetical protein KBD24_01605 [Candidatus Pacebacteria bacterium]|nr:hypothetical protein [Candidatus Paceibacterota bacterium]